MKETVLALAKAAIMAALGQPVDLNVTVLLERYPQLKQKGAAFVTINKKPNDALRGCIGSLVAHRPLYEDIIYNAKTAALNDPRFKPLSPEELDDIKVEVSILSETEEVHYTDIEDLKRKIRPYKDGVVLKHGNRQATYLPQVWEDLPNFDLFFASLCQKAGLAPDCLKLHPKIERYQVTKYKED